MLWLHPEIWGKGGSHSNINSEHMKGSPFQKLIFFDELSVTPKYLQLANCIVKAMEDGKLSVGDMLPSINELSFHYEICRDTAEKGYKHLKSLGLIGSVPGKGYFVSNTDVESTSRVFLLFNKLSPHKKIIYDSFVQTLGSHVRVDFYIYNNDLSLFRRLLDSISVDYNYFVIIPHFIEGEEQAPKIINQIDKEKLILLDKLLPGVTGNFSAVYESFKKDIQFALEQAIDRLRNYQSLKLIFPENSYYPVEIIEGFTAFCKQYDFDHQIIHDVQELKLNKGDVYINLMDDDLVELIEKIMSAKLQLGKEVGVISYNETPLKRIIQNGITTISTDFEAMGRMAGEIVRTSKKERKEVPFFLNLRSSL